MDTIVDIAQDIEKLVLVLTNIILAIYSVLSTIKIRRWKQTADFIGSQLVKEEQKTIDKPQTQGKLMFSSPKYLKSYVQKVKI